MIIFQLLLKRADTYVSMLASTLQWVTLFVLITYVLLFCAKWFHTVHLKTCCCHASQEWQWRHVLSTNLSGTCNRSITLAQEECGRYFFLNNYKQNMMSQSLLAGRTVIFIYLSYTYTSIALDTRLLAHTYQPSQIELSSPGIQKSCRGLIRGLIPGLIFFCPALPSSWSRPGEKKQGISAKQL